MGRSAEVGVETAPWGFGFDSGRDGKAQAPVSQGRDTSCFLS